MKNSKFVTEKLHEATANKLQLFTADADIKSWLKIQYNTIQILLSTPHGGFSETNINSTGNQNKQTNKKYSRIVDKQLLRNNYYETICM